MIKTIIQVAEVWIWLTVALWLGWKFISIMWFWVFEPFKTVLNNLSILFGFTYADIFVKVLIWILIVMGARWIISFVSNNWWQTPNNNWN